MDRPTRRAINHCRRVGEKWGERERRRDGRAAGRREKRKRAIEESRETGRDGVRDERLGQELKKMDSERNKQWREKSLREKRGQEKVGANLSTFVNFSIVNFCSTYLYIERLTMRKKKDTIVLCSEFFYHTFCFFVLLGP